MRTRSLRPPLIFLTVAVVLELLGISLCGSLNRVHQPSDSLLLLTGVLFWLSPFLILAAVIWLSIRAIRNSGRTADPPPPPRPQA